MIDLLKFVYIFVQQSNHFNMDYLLPTSPQDSPLAKGTFTLQKDDEGTMHCSNYVDSDGDVVCRGIPPSRLREHYYTSLLLFGNRKGPESKYGRLTPEMIYIHMSV